jgi:hypothetical protein
MAEGIFFSQRKSQRNIKTWMYFFVDFLGTLWLPCGGQKELVHANENCQQQEQLEGLQ